MRPETFTLEVKAPFIQYRNSVQFKHQTVQDAISKIANYGWTVVGRCRCDTVLVVVTTAGLPPKNRLPKIIVNIAGGSRNPKQFIEYLRKRNLT